MFAGFEVSGIVDEICPTVSDCSLSVGDRVVVYPTNDEELSETGLVIYSYLNMTVVVVNVLLVSDLNGLLKF